MPFFLVNQYGFPYFFTVKQSARRLLECGPEWEVKRMSTRAKKPARNGYIFYDNLGTDELGEFYNRAYWQDVRTEAESYFSQVEGSAPSLNSDTVQYLRNMADTERKKELALLSDYLGCTVKPQEGILEAELINILTENLSIKTEADKVLNIIRDDLRNGSDWIYYAPKLTGHYIWKEVEKVIDKIPPRAIEEIMVDGRPALFNAEWSRLVEPAVERGLENFLRATGEDVGGRGKESASTWNEILGLYNQIEDFRKRFVGTAYEKFGLKNISRVIMKDWREAYLKEFGSNGDVAEYFRTKISGDVKQRMNAKGLGNIVGGFLLEDLSLLKKDLGLSKNNHFVSLDVKVNSNIAPSRESIDITTVLARVDTKVEMDILSRGTEGKEDAFRKHEAFLQAMNQHQGSSIIYESTKLYGMGDGFRGFRGSSFNFPAAIAMLNTIGYPHAEALLNKLNQTARGAIYQKNAADIRRNAAGTLSQYIAYFLFDDWKSIGKDPKGGANTIHVFNLSYIIVPLSWLLYKLADAMEESLDQLKAGRYSAVNPYVRIRFDISDTLFSYPADDKSVEASELRWKEQQLAAQKSVVHVDFLENFKKLIQADFSLLA